MKKYYPLVLLVLLFNACSDFKGNEDSVVSSLAPPVCDNSTPSISEVSAIGTTTDTTPDYVFSSTHSGAITFSGSCSSSNTSANVGQNTITLNELNTGTYTNCRLQVTDSCLGLTSNNLRLSNFTISEPCDDSDNTSPILSESVRIGFNTDNNTNDTTPNYIFASNESGTITYAGSCMSNTTSASIGNNTIELRLSSNSGFSHGMYNDCSLRVTDCNGNVSDNLTISPFNVHVREELYSVTYGNGHFVAVGDGGRILTSPTGDNNSWTVQESGTTNDLYDVGTDNHSFVAVGYRGKLIRSADNGTTWTNGVSTYTFSMDYNQKVDVVLPICDTCILPSVECHMCGYSWMLNEIGKFSFGTNYQNDFFYEEDETQFFEDNSNTIYSKHKIFGFNIFF